MKKKSLVAIAICFFAMSCSSTKFSDVAESFFGEKLFGLTSEQKYNSKLASYKLEAKIITNKGDINVYLYPEVAPETVANFVYLSKKNFYDDMKFSNVSLNNIIQSGDSKGDTTGTAGYYIKDEETKWLTFDNYGVIAMAQQQGAKNTASSQFFITLREKPEFNGKYTAFGNLKSKEDLRVAKTIRQGDIIKDVEITGINVNEFLNNFEEQIKIWDSKYSGK